ncbi:hypothetical protein RHGRI_010808 [Rhododendron griersonianum]|uniref:PIN-like protein n=1 Tax=Rhododendron griersonianum TaxID=479676 RepID=A0AAV6KJM3_9ERIC|nr:hypothetical protein RHGRI_010808 [Rhododendron griersonianum]
MAAVAAAASVAFVVSTMELRWRTFSHTQGWNSSQWSNIASIVLLHGVRTTVLIPSMFVNQMGGSNVEKAKVIQTLLFVSGQNTRMQSLFGTRLPSLIGGSYAFVIPMTSILHAGRYHLSSPEPNGDYCTYHKFERTMRGMQGALIVASCFQMLIGFLRVWRNVVRFLTPLSMVPLMTFTGLGLYYLGFQMLAKCVEIGIPELILMVIASQASYIFLIHSNGGRPTFQAGEAFAMTAASLVASLEVCS